MLTASTTRRTHLREGREGREGERNGGAIRGRKGGREGELEGGREIKTVIEDTFEFNCISLSSLLSFLLSCLFFTFFLTR